jgi:hypothetical protein
VKQPPAHGSAAHPGRSGADVLPPELLGVPEPPPQGSWAATALRLLARVVLWALILVGALRGLLPSAPGPGASATAAVDRQAAAVAAAFLREYLTVGGDRAARAARLGRFTAAGVDLDRSVSLPPGVSQYADQVVASGTRPVDGGIEVTVLAHVLQLRSGGYHDGGLLAFVVPLAGGQDRLAVRGAPRPTTPPVAAGLPLRRPQALSPALAAAAARVARHAVVALVQRDTAELTRLGGGIAPDIRPLPPGWRAVGVGAAEVAGPAGVPTARVRLRARAPGGAASYLVPVHVRMDAGPHGVIARHVDAGGR